MKGKKYVFIFPNKKGKLFEKKLLGESSIFNKNYYRIQQMVQITRFVCSGIDMIIDK